MEGRSTVWNLLQLSTVQYRLPFEATVMAWHWRYGIEIWSYCLGANGRGKRSVEKVARKSNRVKYFLGSGPTVVLGLHTLFIYWGVTGFIPNQ